MPNVTYPGVYIYEVPSGVRPIDMAGTSTAAFVGVAEMGPEEPTRVTSWAEFQRLFGGFPSEGYLAQSVLQFFSNGGRQCYILRVVQSDAAAASVTVANRADPPVEGVIFSAKTKGAWGNSLVLQIEDGTIDPGNEFRVSVRRQADPDVVPTDFNANTPALETFDDLSGDPTSPRFVETVLARQSILITAKMRPANKFQNGLHRSGDNPTTPLNDNLNLQISVDGDGFQVVTLPDSARSADLAGVAAAIQSAVRALTKNRASTDATAFTQFTCVVEPSAGAGPKRLVLRSGTKTANSSVRIQEAPTKDASKQLKLGASLGVSEDGAAVRRPANADWVQIGDAQKGGVVVDVTPGDDGSNPLTPSDFTDAFPRLNTVTDASLLAVPGEASTTVMKEAMGYCAGRPLSDMFFIGETARDDQSPDGAERFRDDLTANSYGALYYPWIKALDPSGRSQDPVLLPPSGYIAGLYSRTDGARGVWKAPAGTEATLNGVVGLGYDLTDTEHGNLNKKGICALRRFRSSGVVAFGARTVSGPADAEWRYIPVRRTAIMLRTSIYYSIQWAVFEPNDEPLWSQLRLNVGSFMTTLFRQGAFQGSSTTEAFYVKCDHDTTTQADIDLGIVNVEVGFAPLKPAEFVIVKISQKAGQASS